jgi:SAM-dependent methyltransferase
MRPLLADQGRDLTLPISPVDGRLASGSRLLHSEQSFSGGSKLSDADQVNADQLAFWNGVGGETWVARQTHTDMTLQPVSDALVAHAGPQSGESVLDVGCGCGASTLDFARAVGPSGSVEALDISAPMLAEAKRRASAAGLANVEWRQRDAATAPLHPYDLLTSMFGLMFFGDPVAAFAHMRGAAKPGARMSFVCWRTLAENPWMEVPMGAVSPHLPPRPPGNPNGPGMFAFADPNRVSQILTDAGWADPTFTKFDCSLDIAAGRGLDEAVAQSTSIGAVNSWLRNESPETIAAATESLRVALESYADGSHVRLPAAMWLADCASA